MVLPISALAIALSSGIANAAATPHFWLYETPATPATLLPVTNITRFANYRFENLAIRASGEILTTNANPAPRLWQVDPLGILPPTLIYQGQNGTGLAGIAEGKPDIFYVAGGYVSLTFPIITKPDTYTITEVDMRNVSVLPDGNLTQQPTIKTVAHLEGAALLNGVTFAPNKENLLVADSFQGLIWNVNVSSGAIGVALNDTTTKGVIGAQNGTLTGINGIRVHNSTIYWTVTGRNAIYTIPVSANGSIPTGAKSSLLASNVTCDDLAVDDAGNAYIASPYDVITKVAPDGKQKVIAGIFNTTSSNGNLTLAGPTSVRFGRLASDRWSLYISTNGALTNPNPNGTQGISRIDLPVMEMASA